RDAPRNNSSSIQRQKTTFGDILSHRPGIEGRRRPMPDARDHRLDPSFVRNQIERLLTRHPELQDDELLRADMIEGETNFHEFLTLLVRQIVEAQAYAAGIELLVANTRARQSRYEHRVEALRALAFALLNHAGVNRVELHQATLSIRAGTPNV